MTSRWIKDRPPYDGRYLSAAELDDQRSRTPHCEIRLCREPVTCVTHQIFTTQDGEKLLSELFRCTAHGEAFAARHSIVLGPSPEEGSR